MKTEAYDRGYDDGLASLDDPNEMFWNPYFDLKKEKQSQEFDDYWEGFYAATDNGRLYKYD